MQQLQQSKVYNAAMWHGLFLAAFLVLRFFIMVNSDANTILNIIFIALTIGVPFVAYYLGKDIKKKPGRCADVIEKAVKGKNGDV